MQEEKRVRSKNESVRDKMNACNRYLRLYNTSFLIVHTGKNHWQRINIEYMISMYKILIYTHIHKQHMSLYM